MIHSFCIKTSRLDDEWKKYSKIKYKVRLCSFNMLNHSDNFINFKIANIQIIETYWRDIK